MAPIIALSFGLTD
ncbi:uncharacterized protein FFFS_03797 [Fusarium fujikuroi]|nr:uncharacterized protein FFFS_03797 [Fusarium fujikuroi]